ncbi:MAG: polysaccharide biosynthesis protein, partial [Methyloligellaceae bacterium]
MRFRALLLDLPRWSKRVLLIGNDFCLLTLALWSAYCLRLGYVYVPFSRADWLVFGAAPVIGVGIFYLRGLYRLVTRYIGQEAATRIYITIVLAVLTWALFILMTGVAGVPRSVVVLYGLIAAFLIRSNRQLAGWILKGIPHATPARFDPRTRVAIYGAGKIGLQLLRALNESAQYKPVAFIDDDKSLWGQVIQRVKVYRPEKIAKIIERNRIEEIFLAMPTASRQRRRAVIRGLEPYPVMVKTVPDLADIASGAIEVSDLRPIDVEDLLGRDAVPPIADLLQRDIRGKAVMITGAGGSIGSELGRQVLRLGPTRLVLYELSEVALYDIENEVLEIMSDLRAKADEDGAGLPEIEIVPVLGSVLDRGLLAHVIKTNGIETIYHAAAYKHVPIVEGNPVTGLRNNTFGTLAVAETAKELGVARLVLISTDKAVR